LNLLGNALKFTKKGFIKIRLFNKTEGLSKNAELKTSYEPIYLIEVEDSGLGIKLEDQPRLFKLFGKLEIGENYRMNPGGVGLGLVISQSLVKVLNDYKEGSEITIRSEWEKGSVFQFTLHSCASENDSFGIDLKKKKNFKFITKKKP
jgi:signal transduction histidine kinase